VYGLSTMDRWTIGHVLFLFCNCDYLMLLVSLCNCGLMGSHKFYCLVILVNYWIHYKSLVWIVGWWAAINFNCIYAEFFLKVYTWHMHNCCINCYINCCLCHTRRVPDTRPDTRRVQVRVGFCTRGYDSGRVQPAVVGTLAGGYLLYPTRIRPVANPSSGLG
jgi:hypothetical protein